MPTKRTFEPYEAQRKAAERELAIFIDALGHDPQFAIHRACRILEILALPGILKRRDQMVELEKRLALYRESIQFGRPWTFEQLRRCFYARARDFRRLPPKPVTREELAGYVAYRPPSSRRVAT